MWQKCETLRRREGNDCSASILIFYNSSACTWGGPSPHVLYLQVDSHRASGLKVTEGGRVRLFVCTEKKKRKKSGNVGSLLRGCPTVTQHSLNTAAAATRATRTADNTIINTNTRQADSLWENKQPGGAEVVGRSAHLLCAWRLQTGLCSCCCGPLVLQLLMLL